MKKEIIKYKFSFIIVILNLILGLFVGLSMGIYRNKKLINLKNKFWALSSKDKEIKEHSKKNDILYKLSLFQLINSFLVNKIKFYTKNLNDNKSITINFEKHWNLKLKNKPIVLSFLNVFKINRNDKVDFNFNIEETITNEEIIYESFKPIIEKNNYNAKLSIIIIHQNN